MKAGMRKEIDLTEGRILPKILLFALPIMATGILQIAFNATDSLIVGRFVGDDALGAVSSTSSVFHLLINFCLGFSVGANVLIANYYGAKREKDFAETVSTSVVVCIVLGILVLITGEVFSRQLLILLKTPDKVLKPATEYLRILFFGAPAHLFYNFSAAMMRSVGDTRRPMWFLLIAVGLNAVLDVCFSLILPGVFSVALATVISEYAAAGMSLVALIRNKGVLRLDRKRFVVSLSKVWAIIRIGLPVGIQSVIFSFANMFVQSAINGFGRVAVAGNGAAYQIENFIYYGILAFSHSGLNFVSQNRGTGRYDRIRKGFFINLAVAMTLGIILGGGSFLFGRPLLRLFTKTEEAVDYGMVRLLCVVLPYTLVAAMETLAGSVRGLGISIAPTLVSLAAGFIIRVCWVAFVFPMDPTFERLLIMYPITWIVACSGHLLTWFVVYHRQKKAIQNERKQAQLSEN